EKSAVLVVRPEQAAPVNGAPSGFRLDGHALPLVGAAGYKYLGVWFDSTGSLQLDMKKKVCAAHIRFETLWHAGLLAPSAPLTPDFRLQMHSVCVASILLYSAEAGWHDFCAGRPLGPPQQA